MRSAGTAHPGRSFRHAQFGERESAHDRRELSSPRAVGEGFRDLYSPRFTGGFGSLTVLLAGFVHNFWDRVYDRSKVDPLSKV